jgi:hypothetical protein
MEIKRSYDMKNSFLGTVGFAVFASAAQALTVTDV